MPDLPAEITRLEDDARRATNWKRWGPYLAGRQWATVREDYSADGDCWNYFPHDHARSRAYRWGEDGLLGLTDRQCRLCFAVALWNGRDPILKERLFGLTGPEGNNGEDVKEAYFYLDSTPTHSYMEALYKYPHAEFPYQRLVDESRRRTRGQPEFELADAGVFDESRYFDVLVRYAKASPNDILIEIQAINRGPERAALHVLPTLWARNTWSWGRTSEESWPKPTLTLAAPGRVLADHGSLGRYVFSADAGPDGRPPPMLFTENETNIARIFGTPNATPYVKDAFHEYVIAGRRDAVNPANTGTKAAAHFMLDFAPGESKSLRFRLAAEPDSTAAPFGPGFAQTVAARRADANAFYAAKLPAHLGAEERRVARQAYAGLLWNKQFYHYVVGDWLHGDPAQPPPAPARLAGRNADWKYVFCRDVISMPDNWEYPWFAAWDLAFHVIALARVDPDFAKDQLILLLREWYMHPSGQIPAYEFNFSDVNPPVHAWACWRVYKITARRGERDRAFLERAFHKLLINFTWWVNRKDPSGRNLFAGGFLGLDNIGVFDRNQPLPSGVRLEQADATAWMAFYCGTMLSIALELARDNPAYEDVASKFFEHFVAIVDAMNSLGGSGLWDEEDGFYYDQLLVHGEPNRLKVRSMVGIIPLFAAEVLDDTLIAHLPGFSKRMNWFIENRTDLSRHISYLLHDGQAALGHRLLAIPSRERLLRMMAYVVNENELLSPFGVRSLSKAHAARPFVFTVDGSEHRAEYSPGESTTGLFGGNSNWRGPIWFPLNYLLIEALERYDYFYGPTLTLECPTGSGRKMTFKQVADHLRARLARLFLPDASGRRPCHGDDPRFATDPAWRDLLLFHEYFHAETGQGLGANHQTGWTALIAPMLAERARDSKNNARAQGEPRA